MSIRATSWVLHESKAAGNDRMVLFVIADEADDEGMNAFPSVDRIAKHANIDRTTAMRVVTRLEEQGELLVRRPATHGRGRFNRYALVMGRDPDDLLGMLGWERSQTATIPEGVDNCPSEPPADPVNGSERSHDDPLSVAPSATRPVVRPIDTGLATPRTSGKPVRRRGLDPPEPSSADQQAAAARAIAERHDQEGRKLVELASPAVAKAELAKARANLRKGRAS